jgi:hypothetical protein
MDEGNSKIQGPVNGNFWCTWGKGGPEAVENRDQGKDAWMKARSICKMSRFAFYKDNSDTGELIQGKEEKERKPVYFLIFHNKHGSSRCFKF